MDKVRFGIVGCGNMGTNHAKNFLADKIPSGVITAVCDINPEKFAFFKEKYADSIGYFENAEDMFKSGLCDCVVICTPHYSHGELAVSALKAGLHTVVEKPAGVYTLQVKEMLNEAKKYDKLLGIMFNQRTNPAFIKMRNIIKEGGIGAIKRTNWIITNWYRTQRYYDSGDWRATWVGEGGGVLYNQAPHQLDLFQWIVGMMPEKLRSFCHFGKWHNIEVEDDVTCYLEYPNGATGVFITTTADSPGTNRFEITGSLGTLIYEDKDGKISLTYTKLETDERVHCFETKEAFSSPKRTTTVEEFEGSGPQHYGILNNVCDAILNGAELYAPAEDGLYGVMLANAMHLSTWLDKEITLPFDDELFYEELKKRIAVSKPRENVVNSAPANLSSTY